MKRNRQVNMSPIDLFQFRSDTFSQSGEDGILETLIDSIGIDKGCFVEFGAWDGVHLSNCRKLVDREWNGCFIEADERRFRQLQTNLPQDNITKVNSLIQIDGEHSLDAILLKHGVEHVDLLSIDIDSDDLAVWQSIKHFRPTIVIIEYNPIIPFDTRYVNERGHQFGNSALSIAEFARSRDYKLVEGTNTNLIFLLNDADPNGAIQSKTLQQIKDQLTLSRYFFGYDGTLLTNPSTLRESGISELFPVPWSHLPGTQPIPRFLRGFGDEGSLRRLLRTTIVAGIVFLRSPIQLLKLLFSFGSMLRERKAAARKHAKPDHSAKTQVET